MSVCEPDDIPDDIRETAKAIQLRSLPDRWNMRYTAQYNAFKTCRKTKHNFFFAEDILVVYFSEMTLWTLFSIYSMLIACILAFGNLDVKSYKKFNALLKKKKMMVTYIKKSKVLSCDISRFCDQVDDYQKML